ncbi:hypothetical protein NGRA_1128 [Nosema granulosis]|uniref:Uncharacterized protein n=1 Tax=Nosema granulosis TaxID=83296 RepID=A0A9P6H011_9MICR|nr:hypothetical protein NGRA_1128 [Nosema granulosis]
MLKIKNLTMSLEENVLCKNQEIHLTKGVCAVVGEHGSLRNALGVMYTNSSAYNMVGLDFQADFELGRRHMQYETFKRYLNPYIHFDMEDTVENTLIFVNYKLYEEIIRDFKLADVRNERVVDLNVSMYKIWEMAIASASQAKIVYVSQPFTSRKKFRYFLKKMKKYLQIVGSYIFVELHDVIEFDFDNALVIRDSSVKSIALRKDSKYKKLHNILLNERCQEKNKKISKKDAIRNSKDFYAAYITNTETSSVLYSSFENNPDIFERRQSFLQTFCSTSFELLTKFTATLRIMFFILIRIVCNIFYIRIESGGIITMLKRSIIFLIRKVKDGNKTDRLSDLYTSLGVLTYFYFITRFFKSIILTCIYILTRACDIVFAVIFALAFEGFVVGIVYLFMVCKNTKHSKTFISQGKFCIVPYQNHLMITKGVLLKINSALFVRGGDYVLVKINEMCKNFVWNILLTISCKKARSLYNWTSILRNITARDLFQSFYEAGTRSLSSFEFKIISSIIIGSVLYSNYTLVEEDEIFIRETLYVTIHPLTYYIFIISYCLISTLPLFIFSLITFSTNLLSVYFNVIFGCTLLNTFFNSRLKIIIISLIVILNFLFPQNILSQISSYKFVIANIIVNYGLFCILLTLFI